MLNIVKFKKSFSSVHWTGIKPVFFILIILLTCFSLEAQENLVPNPSFEEYYSCPTAPDNGDGQLEKCKEWYKPNYATSDYMNACAPVNNDVSVPSNFVGHQSAFDGNAYISLYFYSMQFPTHAEYIQCKLREPLKPCYKYYFSMRVSLADYSAFSTSAIGMRVDKTPIRKELGAFDQYEGFELPCHVCSETFITDTADWVKISGSFIADGSETYLTIGRFFDTSIYSNANYPIAPFDCDSCFWIDNVSYYYIDSVQLIELNTVTDEKLIPNVLTANSDQVNDYWYPTGTCLSDWTCSILNRWGELVFVFNESDPGWNGKNQDGTPLTGGAYFYVIQDKNYNKQTGFIQLIR